MTLKEGQRQLDSFLGALLSTLGFQHVEPLIYSRPENEATALLAFPCRIDARGPCFFGCNVWLRFDSLERKLRGSYAKANLPTVAMPLHLIGEHEGFQEWQFNAPEDLAQLRRVILEKLQSRALPFIAQYSKLSEFRMKLESAKPKDWFVLDPEQRVNALAVAQFVQGDRAAALKTLDDALLERKAALPKKRFPIEVVRKRLIEDD